MICIENYNTYVKFDAIKYSLTAKYRIDLAWL